MITFIVACRATKTIKDSTAGNMGYSQITIRRTGIINQLPLMNRDHYNIRHHDAAKSAESGKY